MLAAEGKEQAKSSNRVDCATKSHFGTDFSGATWMEGVPHKPNNGGLLQQLLHLEREPLRFSRLCRQARGKALEGLGFRGLGV